ncbi:MAG: histidine kinase [Pseudohongiellaceae bacterium]
MSLRIRLSIIVSLLFLTGLVLGISFLVSNARQRVTNEVESTATLTYELVDTLLPGVGNAPGTRNNTELIESLLNIENARHMDIWIEDPAGQQGNSAPEPREINAPGWFVNLVRPEAREFVKPLSNASGEVLVIRTNPADEIAEVWLESKNFMSVLLLVLLVLNSILYITIGRWFRPVSKIVEGLEDVEQGKFSGYISNTSLPELKVIAEKLNKLTSVLKTSQEENDRLTRQSLMIQEEERRHLAQELHDEMGQSISAIKAIAFSIAQRTRAVDEMSSQGAGKIEVISNHVRDHVRSMMGRLRPAVLDELGLIAALQVMVDEWNDHHKNTFCSFRVDNEFGQLDQNQNIHIYRIVQEALTNVAKHSQADNVDVDLVKNTTFHVSIRDNGAGSEIGKAGLGMGLSGIKERARALDGLCDIRSSPGSGFGITIDFPAS